MFLLQSVRNVVDGLGFEFFSSFCFYTLRGLLEGFERFGFGVTVFISSLCFLYPCAVSVWFGFLYAY